MIKQQLLSSAASLVQGASCLCLAVLLFLCAIIYIPGLDGPFLFDDQSNIVQNTLLHVDGSEVDEFRVAAFSSGSGPLSRPVTMLTFALNYAFGDTSSPYVFKLTNLIVHLTIGLFIYLLVRVLLLSPANRARYFTLNEFIALASAAIWLIHPLQVSTVLYPVQRMAQLSTLFVVVGLWVFVRARLKWAERGAELPEICSVSLWLLLVGVLATLSKENGALLGWLILVVEVTLFNGIWKGERKKVLVFSGYSLFFLPFLLLALIFLVNPGLITSGYDTRNFTLAERLLTQSRLLWEYLSWMLVPDIRQMGLHHDYLTISRGLFEPVSTMVSLAGWVVVLTVAVALRQKYPLLLFGLLFFLIAHSMESSFLALEMVYEHRNYLPSIGVAVFVGAIVVELVSRYKSSVILAVAPIIFCGVLLLLHLRVQAWSSELLLTKTAIDNHPESARAHFFYAQALQEEYRRLYRNQSLEDSDGEKIIATSRNHLLLMHEKAPEDIAALVGLILLDARFYSAADTESLWFERIRSVLDRRAFQASDFNAIAALSNCVINSYCSNLDAQKTRDFLADVWARYPQNRSFQTQQYMFFKERPENGAQQRAGDLDLIAEKYAGRATWHFLLQEYCERGEIDKVFKIMSAWLQADQGRRDLPLLKGFLNKGLVNCR